MVLLSMKNSSKDDRTLIRVSR